MTPEAIPYILTKTEIDHAVSEWQKGNHAPFYDLIRRVIETVHK